MSEAAAAPAATTEAAPSATPSSGAQPVVPTLKSGGGITPARDPSSGKFAKGEAAPVVDDDPEFDLGDGMKLKRSALKSELGRARSASKILTEAQKEKAEAIRIRQASEERQAARKSAPTKAIIADLRADGFTDEQIREHLSGALYAEFIEPEHLSEEQKELRALKEWKAQQEAKEKDAETKRAQTEAEKATDEAAQHLMQEIEEAIETGRLPKARAAVRRVASEMAKFEARGIQVPLDVVISKVRDEVGRETGEFAASATVDDLRELWGPQAWKSHVDKVLRWAVAQAKAPTAAQQKPQPRAVESGGERKRISPHEFDRLMKKGAL